MRATGSRFAARGHHANLRISRQALGQARDARPRAPTQDLKFGGTRAPDHAWRGRPCSCVRTVLLQLRMAGATSRRGAGWCSSSPTMSGRSIGPTSPSTSPLACWPSATELIGHPCVVATVEVAVASTAAGSKSTRQRPRTGVIELVAVRSPSADCRGPLLCRKSIASRTAVARQERSPRNRTASPGSRAETCPRVPTS